MSTTTAAPSGFKLPTTRIASVHKNPKNLIIFSKPKTGKTTLLAALDNCLLLDFEDGSDYVEAMKIKIKNLYELSEAGRAILDAGRPYKYIALDTVTALEEMCIPRAEELYSKSIMGKNWYTKGKLEYRSILNLPNGAGYPWLREAFTEVVKFIATLAPHIILLGHLKDTMIQKNGGEFNASDLNLTGKIKQITCAQSDAIGYLYRKANQNILTFKTQDEVACGARPDHLKNKEIVISEVVTDAEGNEEMKFYWDKVFVN